MKKEKFVLTVLTTLLSIQVITAQAIIDRTIQGISQTFVSIFSPIFGTGSGEFLFAKILLFFLLFGIIFMSLRKIDLFDDNTPVHVITTLVVSIFAVRYLKEGGFINAILLPYQALGIAMSIFLPLIIFFYFVHKSQMGGFGRRAAWFLYGLVFLVLWGSREYDTLGNANWVYGFGIGFILVSLIFDKSIHNYFRSTELEGSSKSNKRLDRIHIKSEMKGVTDAWKNGLISKGEYNATIKDLKRRYKGL